MARDLRQVLDAVIDGVVVVDATGAIDEVNAEACRILENSAQALAGTPVEQLLGPDHAAAKLVRTVLATGRAAIESDQSVARRFDSSLIVDVAAAPLLGDAGQTEGVVLLLRDHTVRTALEAVVSDRERLDAFGRIAAGIAHEVKNPLGGIRGAAELLLTRARDKKTAQTAELIVREVDRITNLVDDLMVFARGDKLQLERVNVHQALDEVLDLLTHDPLSANVRVERRFDPSLPELSADRDRLIQVFLNLARNALQAMDPAGGTLTIETRVSFDRHLVARDHGQHGAVLVEMRDTGPGIPEELLGKVATPFFTTRSSGTGLGLPLAEHWVTLHGGTMAIESKVGEGTRVRVTLPIGRPS